MFSSIVKRRLRDYNRNVRITSNYFVFTIASGFTTPPYSFWFFHYAPKFPISFINVHLCLSWTFYKFILLFHEHFNFTNVKKNFRKLWFQFGTLKLVTWQFSVTLYTEIIDERFMTRGGVRGLDVIGYV